MSLLDKPTVVSSFQGRYPFQLDDFQREAIDELIDGRSVLVAAPTGTGKTVIAEFAVYLARLRGRRVMYTTPIKALSNQKFRDFRTAYGEDVGLLTGDVVENRAAAILIMTTEVLRNMILQTPRELDDVGVVVFDEIHYLADPERGTAWEECIVLAPKHLIFVCLSATVTNARDLATWISLVHRPIHLIEHYSRAVPLLHHYYLDNQAHLVLDEEQHLIADFPNVGGEARRRIRGGWTAADDRRSTGLVRAEPDPIEIVQSLQRADMLPAIYFLFSRRDCEAAADVCALMRLRLARDPTVAQQIARVVESHLSRLAPEDRQLEQVKAIVRLAHRGLGFHHAGLLPVLKQLVEELFAAGLMGTVFATDTLALGINMPARTVVIGRMAKFDGQSRRPLSPNEFQQMAGRAGRRGIDDKGHVVIPYSPWMPFREAMDIAVGALHPVESSFTLRYNTVLNLWDPPGGQRLLRMQRDSLMQFQMAHQTRALAERVQQVQREIDAVPRGCLIGYDDGETLLSEYDGLVRMKAALRHNLEHLRREEAQLDDAAQGKPWQRPTREELRKALRIAELGMVIHDEQLGWGIYLGRDASGHNLVLAGARVAALDTYHRIDYLPDPRVVLDLPPVLLGLREACADLEQIVPEAALREVDAALQAAHLPDLEAEAAAYQDELRADLAPERDRVHRDLAKAHSDVNELQQRIGQHACEPCPVRKQHRRNLRVVARVTDDKAEAEAELQRHIGFEEKRARRVLGAIVSVLHEFGYLRRGIATPKAKQLANVFDANGLVLAEALGAGWLHELGAEDIAEVLSWFAYDRDFEFANRYVLPHHLVRLRRDLDELQARIFAAERRSELTLTIGYNYYFYGMARAWCRGAALAEILGKVALGEGDVVATFNKTIDLLRQLAEMLAKVLPRDALREKLARAQRLMTRGIVEQSLLLGLVPATLSEPALPPDDASLAQRQPRTRRRPAP